MESRRRCIVTGDYGSPAHMLRFVVDPQDRLIPDISGKLAGRGFWLSSSREVVAGAIKKGSFSRAASRTIEVGNDLAHRVEALLVAKSHELIGLAQRAKLVVIDFEKIRHIYSARQGLLLLEASDREPRTHMILMGDGSNSVFSLFSCAELSLALGRENVVHAAVIRSKLAERVLIALLRLEGFRKADRIKQKGEAGPFT